MTDVYGSLALGQAFGNMVTQPAPPTPPPSLPDSGVGGGVKVLGSTFTGGLQAKTVDGNETISAQYGYAKTRVSTPGPDNVEISSGLAARIRSIRCQYGLGL